MRRESRTGKFASLEKPTRLISLKLFEDQIEELDKLSEELDLSKSELIRSFVSEGVNRLASKKTRQSKQDSQREASKPPLDQLHLFDNSEASEGNFKA